MPESGVAYPDLLAYDASLPMSLLHSSFQMVIRTVRMLVTAI